VRSESKDFFIWRNQLAQKNFLGRDVGFLLFGITLEEYQCPERFSAGPQGQLVGKTVWVHGLLNNKHSWYREFLIWGRLRRSKREERYTVSLMKEAIKMGTNEREMGQRWSDIIGPWSAKSRCSIPPIVVHLRIETHACWSTSDANKGTENSR